MISTEYDDGFDAGEMFMAHAIDGFAKRTGRDLSELLSYLGYQYNEKNELEANDDRLGLLPDEFVDQ